MRSLSARMERIERQLEGRLRLERCQLCLEQNVWRLGVNGERQLDQDDPVYDDSWHCRRCGAAAPEIHMVTLNLPDEQTSKRASTRTHGRESEMP
jgi:hypothetical protein